MSEDLRTIRITNAIKHAFIALLQEKPFIKISVSEIAKNAFIDRQTFYLHYTDKYDLLDKMVQEVAGVFKQIMSERLQEGHALNKLKDIYQNHNAYLQEHRLEIISLLKIDTGDICLKRSLKKIFIEEYQKETSEHLTQFQADMMAALYIQTLTLFLDDEKELNIYEVTDLLEKIKRFIN